MLNKIRFTLFPKAPSKRQNRKICVKQQATPHPQATSKWISFSARNHASPWGVGLGVGEGAGLSHICSISPSFSNLGNSHDKYPFFIHLWVEGPLCFHSCPHSRLRLPAGVSSLTPSNSGDLCSQGASVHQPAGNVLVSSSEEPEAGKFRWNLEFLDPLAFCLGTWRLLESRLWLLTRSPPLFFSKSSSPTPPWDLLCTLLACLSSAHSPRESSLPPP